MKEDTKIYSDFIKRNKVASNKKYFAYYDSNNKLKVVPLGKDEKGKWYADQEDSVESKKCAIYWYIKNNNNTLNGRIIRD